MPRKAGGVDPKDCGAQLQQKTQLGHWTRGVMLKPMLTAADALRRWLGMLCLALASGMLIWGQVVLAPYLKGVGFIIYWVICLLFTLAAIVIALLDIRAVRRRTQEERRELLKKTFDDLPRGSVERREDRRS